MEHTSEEKSEVLAVNLYLHAPRLFRLAKRAASEDFADKDGPVISIMFCAVALEAFINESGALATMVPSENQAIVRGYASVMAELEERKESILLKYKLALLVLTGSTWEEQDLLFQEFKLLVALRNEITHLKGDRWEVEVDLDDEDDDGRRRSASNYPKFIRSLHSKGIIALPTSFSSWVTLANDPKVAAWACRVTKDITHRVLTSVPEGKFKDELSKYAFDG
jgi:hypothetical protein